MLRTLAQAGRSPRVIFSSLATAVALVSTACAKNEGSGAAGDSAAVAASSTSASAAACSNNAGITLPAGFCATI
ncbi:MAG TPA: hypothetical protein VE110_08690, partial [Gemmatimonadaceae bacterium]|nr:hypothetical protein [Gemmatimonadaceae bacterium]